MAQSFSSTLSRAVLAQIYDVSCCIELPKIPQATWTAFEKVNDGGLEGIGEPVLHHNTANLYPSASNLVAEPMGWRDTGTAWDGVNVTHEISPFVDTPAQDSPSSTAS